MNRNTSKSERSFSLVETLIALGVMVTVILEVTSVLGKSITFDEYARKSSQGIWLAKAVMSKIEWGTTFYDLKSMATPLGGGDLKFDDVLCPPDEKFDCNFTYSVSIEPWNLPLIDLLTGGGGGDDDEKSEGGAGGGLGDMIKEQVKEILGDEILRVAHVEVFWPEGAKRNSVEATYLLVNQLPLDAFIENLPEQKTGAPQDPNKPPAPAGTPPPAGGTPPPGGPKNQNTPTPDPTGEGDE